MDYNGAVKKKQQNSELNLHVETQKTFPIYIKGKRKLTSTVCNASSHV